MKKPYYIAPSQIHGMGIFDVSERLGTLVQKN